MNTAGRFHVFAAADKDLAFRSAALHATCKTERNAHDYTCEGFVVFDMDAQEWLPTPPPGTKPSFAFGLFV